MEKCRRPVMTWAVSHVSLHVPIRSQHHKPVGLDHPQQQSFVPPARIVLTRHSNTQTRVSTRKVNVVSSAHESWCLIRSHCDGSLFVGFLGEVLGRYRTTNSQARSPAQTLADDTHKGLGDLFHRPGTMVFAKPRQLLYQFAPERSSPSTDQQQQWMRLH